MEHTINLVAGDWSDDGHGKTSNMRLKSNITGQEFQDSLAEAIQLLDLPGKQGLPHQLKLCEDYEDCVIDNPEYIERLGLELIDDQEEAYISSDDGAWDGEANNWFYIMIRLVKRVRPDFEFEVLTPDSIVYIGGYGLYH